MRPKKSQASEWPHGAQRTRPAGLPQKPSGIAGGRVRRVADVHQLTRACAQEPCSRSPPSHISASLGPGSYCVFSRTSTASTARPGGPSHHTAAYRATVPSHRAERACPDGWAATSLRLMHAWPMTRPSLLAARLARPMLTQRSKLKLVITVRSGQANRPAISCQQSPFRFPGPGSAGSLIRPSRVLITHTYLLPPQHCPSPALLCASQLVYLDRAGHSPSGLSFWGLAHR